MRCHPLIYAFSSLVVFLCGALFCEVNPIPVKMALNLMGKEAGTLRPPLTDMEEANVAKLKKVMEEYGIL